MNKQEIKDLLQKSKNGRLSAAEEDKLFAWYNYYAKNKTRESFPNDIWYRKESSLKAILETNIESRTLNKRKFTLKPLFKYVSTAAAVTIITFACYTYYQKQRLKAYRASLYANDISPGKNEAVLTLSNGEQIRLNESKSGIVIDASHLTYNDGTSVLAALKNSSSKKELNTISTPNGGNYKIILPDGTQVWLNAASSIKFPLSFSGDPFREVYLNGEAYFEVRKDINHPFYVNSDKQKVEVLGTHFNVNAYKDEQIIKTTLLEGSVKISGTTNNLSFTLKPGQQLISTLKDSKITSADTEEATAWKEGVFMFNGQNLESIMKMVERWYDVEVIFENEALKSEVFNGSVSRFKKISQLLEVLEATGSVHFKIEGRRVTAMK